MSQLTEEDCERLALLHREALPDSMVSELGLAYARSFYRYLRVSADERVFVMRAERGAVLGGCVLSLRRRTLRRRLLLRTPLLVYLGPWLLRRLVHKPGGGPAQSPPVADPVPGDVPELILIFTAADARSRGTGAALLHQCEEFLQAQGIPEYAVRTVDDPSNRALQFYARNGFVACGQSTDHGRIFRVFKKSIGP